MATTEQFSLRWNNFHSNLTSGFHELLEAGEMVDVTLAVDGHFFQAHKLVLSICSPYFKQMFKVNPCKHPIVILKDVAHENMKDILEFIYMGEVNVLRDNLSTFLRTAELLQVKGLTGDDSQSETSSRREDDKSDSIGDEDPDLLQYNQLIDSDMELPIGHYSAATTPTRVPTPPNSNPAPKRHATKNQSNCHKRHKTDTNNLTSKQQEIDTKPEEIEYLETTAKVEKNPSPISEQHIDENKDNLKHIIDSSNLTGSTATTDSNTNDQDGLLLYGTDQKTHVFCPYCCRKFVNRYNLKVHIRDKHEDNSPVDLDCRICGKVMRNRSCLRVHMYHHRKQQLDNSTPLPIV